MDYEAIKGPSLTAVCFLSVGAQIQGSLGKHGKESAISQCDFKAVEIAVLKNNGKAICQAREVVGTSLM